MSINKEETEESLEDSPSNLKETLRKIAIIASVIIVSVVLVISRNFFISFIIGLIGYSVHTLAHVLEHKEEYQIQSKNLKTIVLIIVLNGWVGYFFMNLFDPVKYLIPIPVAITIGVIILILGFSLIFLARMGRKSFTKEDELITSGVYSIFLHPMYVGGILIHISAPILFNSFFSLVSSFIWITFIIIWMKIDEADLKRIYGEAYLEYKKKVLFRYI